MAGGSKSRHPGRRTTGRVGGGRGGAAVAPKRHQTDARVADDGWWRDQLKRVLCARAIIVCFVFLYDIWEIISLFMISIIAGWYDLCRTVCILCRQ